MYKNNIRNRILIFFLVIIFLLITTLGVISNLVYKKVIDKKTNEYANQIISQVELNIDSYINSVENILFYISNSRDVIDFLSNNSKDNIIKENLKLYVEANPEILGLIIVGESDTYISNELLKKTRDSLKNEIWYKEAINESEKVHFFSKPIGRNLIAYKNYGAEDIMSICKAIIDKNSNKILGVVMIDIKLEKLDDIIKSNYIGENGFFYILDKNNNIVYSPINPIVYRINSSSFNKLSDSLVTSINNEDFKIIYKLSNLTGWKSIGVFSLDYMVKDINFMERFTMIISFISLALAIVFSVIFTNSIVTPIKELNVLMKKVELGNLDLKFNEENYNDEFWELGHSFNHMVAEIKELINIVYKQQRSKRKAEIEVLQAQIKPHFLYNTLDTIAWMAEDYEANEIVNIVDALTKVFRIGLNKGKESIKIKDEIEHIKSYLIIQKYRYEDKLNYNIDYDEEVLDYYILKLITQPIVENAIYHGIKEKKGPGNINISFKRKENKISIVIEDDGKGISEEELDFINNNLNSNIDNLDEVNDKFNKKNLSNKKGSGYGVYNVNMRIKLTYGKEYGLKYESKVGIGTRVEIILP